MKNLFSKTINSGGIDRIFEFRLTDYGSESRYHVFFNNSDSKNNNDFRMYKDENGQWKIAAQTLPIWLFESEIDFNDAIEENETINPFK